MTSLGVFARLVPIHLRVIDLCVASNSVVTHGLLVTTSVSGAAASQLSPLSSVKWGLNGIVIGDQTIAACHHLWSAGSSSPERLLTPLHVGILVEVLVGHVTVLGVVVASLRSIACNITEVSDDLTGTKTRQSAHSTASSTSDHAW